MDPFWKDTVNRVIEEHVMPEIVQADHLHGMLPGDLCRIMTILTEEVGEAAAEALEVTREQNSEIFKSLSRDRYLHEMAQVAAVAIRAIAMEVVK